MLKASLAFDFVCSREILRDISRFPAVPVPRQQRDSPVPYIRKPENLLVCGIQRVFFKELGCIGDQPRKTSWRYYSPALIILH